MKQLCFSAQNVEEDFPLNAAREAVKIPALIVFVTVYWSHDYLLFEALRVQHKGLRQKVFSPRGRD